MRTASSTIRSRRRCSRRILHRPAGPLRNILYSPGLVVVLVALDLADVGTFFTTASLWEFIIVGLFLYLLGLVALRRPALGHDDKVLHGR